MYLCPNVICFRPDSGWERWWLRGCNWYGSPGRLPHSPVLPRWCPGVRHNQPTRIRAWTTRNSATTIPLLPACPTWIRSWRAWCSGATTTTTRNPELLPACPTWIWTWTTRSLGPTATTARHSELSTYSASIHEYTTSSPNCFAFPARSRNQG